MGRFLNIGLIIISICLIKPVLLFGHNQKDTTINQNDVKEINEVFQNLINLEDFIGCPFEVKTYAYNELQYALNHNNTDKEAKANINYANVVYNLGDYSEALKYYKNALNIYIKKKDYKKAAVVCYFFGRTYDNIGKIDSSISYFIKSKDLALKVENKELLELVLIQLIKLYEEKNDYESAYETFHTQTHLKEYLFTGTKRKQINDLHEKYQTEKNMRELRLLSVENEYKDLQLNQIRERIVILIGLTFLAILLSVFSIMQNRRKNRQRILELEQKLLRFQMNPHFIFNSLSSIQSLIYKNQGEVAIQNLTNFSELTNTIFQTLKSEYVSLDTEIASIKHYLELQKIVLKEKLEYFFEVDTNLDPKKVAIPPMLLQPLIENSVLHGINNKTEKGNVYIRFLKKEKSLIIEIEDDGIGRENAKKFSKKEHKSFATEITKSRLQKMNTIFRKKTSFEIFDLKNDDDSPKGTKVCLRFPLKSIKQIVNS